MSRPLESLMARLRRSARPRDAADGDALRRYAATQDPDAFAHLVRRFGPMVQGVCRRALGDTLDADDAYQGTFLVLVRKARTVRPPDAVGSWLFAVAVRTANYARTAMSRRAARLRPMETDPPGPPPPAPPELMSALDAELAALPGKFRDAVVLCELDGKSVKDAAAAVGVPVGTLASRLARGRQALADRLRAKGFTVTAAGVSGLLAGAASAAAPVFDPAAPAAGASTLAHGVMKMALLAKLKLTTAVGLCVLAAGVFGVGLLPGPAVLPAAHAAPVPRPKDPAPGQERSFEIAEKMPLVFCWVPKGKATLGSPNKEANRKSDEAEHVYEEEVGFWLAKYETTQEQWEAVMGSNPSLFAKTGSDPAYRKLAEGEDTTKYPVENVSWDMICGVKGVGGEDTFLGRINARPDIAKTFGAKAKFALPHEDRWEYAARGGEGNAKPFYWGKTLNGTEANCDGNEPYGGVAKGYYSKRPLSVGSYMDKELLHPWGLYDIAGNVYEWCENEYSDGRRVLRGGSWRYHADDCRAANRYGDKPSVRRVIAGFRVCVRLD